MNNITVTREESEICENKQTGFTKLTIQQIMNLLWVAAQVVVREERKVRQKSGVIGDGLEGREEYSTPPDIK